MKKIEKLGRLDSTTVPVFNALKECESILWDGLRPENQELIAQALDIQSRTILKYIQPDTPHLGWMHAWAQIVQAESLFLRSRPDEALALLESMDTSSFTDEQKVGHAWSRGVILYLEKRYTEALEPIETVAAHPTFPYAREARRVLPILRVATIAETSTTFEQALRRFESFLQEQQPSAPEAEQLKTVFLSVAKSRNLVKEDIPP